MAVTITKIVAYPDKYQTIVDMAGDGSYPANGYVLDPKACGVLSVDAVDCSFTTGEGFSACWIASTGKVKAFKNAAGAGAYAEIAAGDWTSSVKCRLSITGKPVL